MNKLLWNTRPLVLVLTMALAGPALAQTPAETEGRLRKVEAEVAAIQRVVFPGGDARFFPQIQPGQATGAAPGSPASAPTADLLARMDALEGQVARLTAQVEEDHNRIEKLDARLAAVEGLKAAADSPTATDSNTAAMTGTPTPAPKPVAVAPALVKPAVPKPTVAADPSAKRVAAVRAIEKPKTDDPGDDEYSYGYRLWDAKFYPEAQQQLKLFLQKYPKHPRTSWARNLLGRAYLDDNNAHEAAGWFLQNYKTEPKGDRAPDSLLYLAEAMRQLDDAKRGCVALKQFAGDYPKEAASRLKTQYDATRTGLKCN